jgi:hypothetical protein
MTQLRLQQACDAGVLAGRRFMGGGTYGNDAKAEASKMFGFNYPEGLHGSEDVRFESTLAEGEVSVVQGTAAARLPTSLMYIFGFGEFDLSVACKAKMEIAHTDVVLVLDVTGSMKDQIPELKDASNDFLDTMLKTTGDGLLRLGVVPYSTTVNVGGVLKPEWLSEQLTIPSRTVEVKTETKPNCTRNCTTTTYNYTYENRTFTVGSPAVGANVTFPAISKTGTNRTVKWGGCIIERQTVAFGKDSAAPEDALDMDINKVPDDEASRWKLFMPGAGYSRSGTKTETSTTDKAVLTGTCPTAAAMKLTVIRKDGVVNATGKEAFETTIGSLAANGNTYHDVGMAWGARLISPNGLFADENGLVNGRPRTRHIVYMTDGAMVTSLSGYTHQGQEQTIPRVTSKGTESDLTARHTNRFLQLCEKAKREGITIWVIAFGDAAKPNASSPSLNQCSSSGTAYKAVEGELEATFRLIANQIARLRLSQ